MASKKILNRIAIGIVLICSLLTGYSIHLLNIAPKPKILDAIKAIEIPLGNRVDLKCDRNPQTSIVVIVSSTCDYCSYEMEQIIGRIDELKSTCISFVSSEEVGVLKKVFEQHKMNEFENIKLFHLSEEEITFAFGFVSKSRPATLVYAPSGELIQSFKGAVHLDKIINISQSRP